MKEYAQTTKFLFWDKEKLYSYLKLASSWKILNHWAPKFTYYLLYNKEGYSVWNGRISFLESYQPFISNNFWKKIVEIYEERYIIKSRNL